MITAYAIYRPASSDPLLFLSLERAQRYSDTTGLPVTPLVQAAEGARDLPVCFAVADRAGQLSLHLDRAQALGTAARLGGTLHTLVEQAHTEAATEATSNRAAQRCTHTSHRDPQGWLTPGGVMRL